MREELKRIFHELQDVRSEIALLTADPGISAGGKLILIAQDRRLTDIIGRMIADRKNYVEVKL